MFSISPPTLFRATSINRFFPRLLLACTLLFALSSVYIREAEAASPITDEAKVDELLSQMTLAEKMDLIRGVPEPRPGHQGQAGYLKGVPRLGIAPLRFADGPPGVLTREPSSAQTATMGLAATFSARDAEQNGIAIGRECLSAGVRVSLQPFINLNRDITMRRAYNTFGEDPFLTGAISAALIRGLQGQGVMAMAKHYVGYDSNATNIRIDDQALNEVYLAPFQDAVDADVASVMTAYNRINGPLASHNAHLLKNVLRARMGFEGFITSDWGAIHAPNAILAGTDMEMPGVPERDVGWGGFSFYDLEAPKPPIRPKYISLVEIAGFLGTPTPEELQSMSGENAGTHVGFAEPPQRTFWNLMQSGKLTEKTITEAARRVLLQYSRFGYLDNPPELETRPHAVEDNARIIQKTSEDAAVLLKNEAGALPLKAADLEALAMIGPGAFQVVAVAQTGERSIGFPWRQIGPVEAMRRLEPTAKITLAVANDMNGVTIPAEMLSHDGRPGLLRKAGEDATQVDPVVEFTNSTGNPLPAGSKLSWSGELKVPQTGRYLFGVQVHGGAGKVSIDGKQVVRAFNIVGGFHADIVHAGKDGLLPTPDGLDNARAALELAAGTHEINIELDDDTSGSPAQIRVTWVTPDQQKAYHEAALAAARSAKKAVVFVWARGTPVFGLPGDQDKLVEDIAAVNPNTIVVLNTSQPVAMPWLDQVKAVLQMWWPGDEGGWATANVLLGRISPAGRLPFTWAKRLADYAPLDPEFPERTGKGLDGATTFSEGVHVGYRWFEKQKIEPLFAFGHGLSYTTFAYSDLEVASAADGGLDVSFTLKNDGLVASDEVPQVYLAAPADRPAGADFAALALAGFDRVSLAAGEEKNVKIHVRRRALEYWFVPTQEWLLATGPREVAVGASSRDIRLRSTALITQPGSHR